MKYQPFCIVYKYPGNGNGDLCLQLYETVIHRNLWFEISLPFYCEGRRGFGGGGFLIELIEVVELSIDETSRCLTLLNLWDTLWVSFMQSARFALSPKYLPVFNDCISGLVTWVWCWCHPAFLEKGHESPVTWLNVDLKIHILPGMYIDRVLVHHNVILRVLIHVHFESKVANTISY